MAGHLARNQVHAGSIPAALTDVGSPPGRCDALQATPDGFDSRALHNHSGRCSWESSRSPKPTDSVRIVADPQRGPKGFGYPLTVSPEAHPLVRELEGAAEWPATGPENPGRGAEPERFDPSAFLDLRWMLTRTVVRAARTRSSKPATRVRLSHGALTRRPATARW